MHESCGRATLLGEAQRAEEVLATGRALLHERAAKISDPALRRSFLENIPAHRALLEAWEAPA